MLSLMVADAVVHCIYLEKGKEFARLLALDQIDAASQSRLLAEAAPRAERLRSVLAASLPREERYRIAPTGTGRRHAMDHGGRIAATVDAWARHMLVPDTSGRIRPERIRPPQTELWRLAHPEAAEVLGRIRDIAQMPPGDGMLLGPLTKDGLRRAIDAAQATDWWPPAKQAEDPEAESA